jgi:anti-anti-sigma factor
VSHVQTGLPIVALSGELDLYRAPAVRASLAQIDGPVVIDLSAVSYIDSSLLNELARLRRRVGEVVLVVSSPQVRRIIDIVGFDRAFRVVDRREDA